MKELTIAILVDGGFFLKRYQRLFDGASDHTPEVVAQNFYECATKHVDVRNYLYRILYYDCVPFEKRIHNPVSGEVFNFGTSEQAKFRNSFFEELKKRRKVALRLGYLKASKNWAIRPQLTKKILSGEMKIEDLSDTDVFYELKQKGIDIKIGVDIASLAYKKLVDRIVLISGDSDFVPAAKLARREGIDFILDPMWNPIDASLNEHIDGLTSTSPKPAIR